MSKNENSIDLVIRLAAIGGLTAWCFIVVRPFLHLVIWAAILAIGLYPVFLWLKGLLGNRATLAATLLTLVGIGVIVGPVGALGYVVFDEVKGLSEGIISQTLALPQPPPGIEKLPLIGESLARLWQQGSNDLASLLERFQPQLEKLAQFLLQLSANAGITILQLLLAMVVTAGFMLNARALRQRLSRVLRKVAPAQSEEILNLTTATLQNVIRGVIGVAIVQTALIAIGLLVGRIPGAGLLALLCFLLVIVQLGPALIVVPSVIYAWMTMQSLSALLFTAWMLFATLIDNILKPLWMGKGLKVPILIVFLGVIGGTLSNGILGLFLGPVILSIGYETLRLWATD